MKQVPDINFKRQTHWQGVEIVDLQELLSIRREQLDHDPILPHRLNFFLIIMIEKGSVRHSVEFTEYELEAGDCLFIAKGQIHAFDAKRAYHGKLILYTEAFLHQHFTPSAIANISWLYHYFAFSPKHTHPEAVADLLRDLGQFAKRGEPYIENLIGAVLTIFMLRLRRQKSENHEESQTKAYQHFIRFKRLVEQDFRQSRDATDYANKLLLSYKHLNTICKKIAGKTAKAYIDAFVMLEAKRLLLATDSTAQEIAFACGFAEATNFQKFFKRHSQQTPIEFRQSKGG
ncbi:MAG: helix-turn-helix transcriptional regulator, partial [Bacteroidota bacterium]